MATERCAIEPREAKPTDCVPLWVGINPQNIEQLRLLNESILPVSYNEKFYEDIPTYPEDITKFGESCYKGDVFPPRCEQR